MAKSIHNYFLYRAMDRQLARAVKQHARGRLLDIGCGTKPYKEMLRPHITEHIGVDVADPFNSATKPEIVGTAYDIPTPDDSFDTALCSAALEHLEHPEKALAECQRVLRPGGIAIYTVPFVYQVHAAPRDYVRYTRYGLDAIFKRAGFEVIEITALSGFWLSAGIATSYYMMRFSRGFIARTRIIPLLTLPVQAICYFLDRLDKAEDWTWMYLVAARKPQP